MQASRPRYLQLHCYYIDYNGTSYLPVKGQFNIEVYDGEKDLAQLSIYPLRFAKDKDKLMEGFLQQGKQFHFAITQRHLLFNGWTLTEGPTGVQRPSERLVSEHIDSNVIVDFAEGFKVHAGPDSGSLNTFSDSDWIWAEDELEIRYWTNDERSERLGAIREITQCSEWFGEYLCRRHFREGKFIRAWRMGNVKELDPEDLVLLPRRAVAYAFRERKFNLVDVHSLKKVQEQDDVLQNLKIDPKHKSMIVSLVGAHFQKHAVQRQGSAVDLNQDLIRGKGAGLVFLLHGVPGVGKTATAEAIAHVNSKPLFAITCGDLGFQPSDVDESLREIFRLANLWDCVLLLDEADVFLSRREVSDLKRNALVSVFLRVLEYYSGILFLTTNRVGHLDEAFKSRVHISLYYPPLSEVQTVAIFDVNIKRLLKIEDEKQNLMNGEDSAMTKRPKMVIDKAGLLEYARWHWEHHEPSERWNGRQIRNAFQIAYSLAQWPAEKATAKPVPQSHSPSPPLHTRPGTTSTTTNTDTDGEAQIPAQMQLKLDYTHFEEVTKVIERFDDYLLVTTANTAANSALMAGTRADEHDPTRRKYVRYRPASSYAPPMQQQDRTASRRHKLPPKDRERFTPKSASGSGEYGGGGGRGGRVGGRGWGYPSQNQPPPRSRLPTGAAAVVRGGHSGPRGKGGGGGAPERAKGSSCRGDRGWDLELQLDMDEEDEDQYYRRDGGGGGAAEMGDGEYYEELEEGMGGEQWQYDQQAHDEDVHGENYDDGYEEYEEYQ